MNLFSCTNNNIPNQFMLHQPMSVNLILMDGMCVLFNCLFSESKSRKMSDGRHLRDLRFYSTVVGKGVVDNPIHHTPSYMCSNFGNTSINCNKCSVSPIVLDFNRMLGLDLTKMNTGDVILGDFNHLGWVVLRGIDVPNRTNYTLRRICENSPHYLVQCTKHIDVVNTLQQKPSCVAWKEDSRLVTLIRELNHLVSMVLPKKLGYKLSSYHMLANTLDLQADSIPAHTFSKSYDDS